VFARTQLTCSIGVATRKYLAKIASDYRKPDGYTYIREQDILQFMGSLEISKIWGIGKVSQKYMHERGVYYGRDLQKYSKEALDEMYGKLGRHIYNLVNGIDERDVKVERAREKSVSNEHTFRENMKDIEKIEQTLIALCEKVTYRVRKKGLKPKTVTLKIRNMHFKTYTRSISFHEAILDHSKFYEIIRKLFEEFLPIEIPIRLVGVGLGNEKHNIEQLNAFDFEHEKQDKINTSFGKWIF
jgi:nucleotidyltransferase/DNA polymerase involved in DNA repair